mgnify:FL=1
MSIQKGLPPIYNADSEVLILGSFPSEKSRESGSYYSNKDNSFWNIICEYYNEPLPTNNSEIEAILHKHHIAVWDMIESCEIAGSSDKKIKDPEYHKAIEIRALLNKSKIKKIIINGRTLDKNYKKYFGEIALPSVAVLSTSPANNGRKIQREQEWRKELP